MIDPKLLEILVWPITKTDLVYKREVEELWAKASGLAFPVRDGIPIMLEDQARSLTLEEQQSLK